MYSSNMVGMAVAQIAGSNLPARSKLLNLLRLRRRLRQYALIVSRGLATMVEQAQRLAAAKLRAIIRNIEASVAELTEMIQPYLAAVRQPGVGAATIRFQPGYNTGGIHDHS